MFNLIVADPPWSFGDKLTMSDVRRSADSQYSTLNSQEITGLGQLLNPLISEDYAVLALWVVSSQLQLGLDVMQSWGFTQKQTVCWAKTRQKWNNALAPLQNLAFGMGRQFRMSHEIALIGIRGKVYPHLNNRSQRSVIFAPNLRHSTKPEEFQDSLDVMYPAATKLELFARRQRVGWTCLGNEIDGQDIRQALVNLATKTVLH